MPRAVALPPAPQPGELAEARQWAAARFGDAASAVPFSFTLAGRPSADVLKTWKRTHQQSAAGPHRARHEITWTDPATSLQVRCSAVVYDDYPVAEWTVYVKNTGSQDAPLLEHFRALDTAFRPPSGDFVLHYNEGSPAEATDYQPFTAPMGPGSARQFAARAGRGCDPWLPYFNLAGPAGGWIVAVGWPGQWAADFTHTPAGVRVRAGQETVRLRLKPGEEIRSPLMAVLAYHSDWLRGQNVWRRWMLAHNLPRPGGKLVQPQVVACSSHQFGEMIHANEANQKRFVDRYLAEGLKIDYWWMDAGWYKNDGTWVNVGTWEPDPKRFPHGLRAITDHAHAKGVRAIVWFEPERVTAHTWLWDHHPEWLLKPAGLPRELAYQNDWRLLNLGDKRAWTWLVNHVDRVLNEQGIDLYRQDFNMDPLYFWRANDAPDRQGATENHYVTGYLAYWDELRRRHPNMLIDSCASGGRRNDLETLRRAVPLIRSDYLFEPTGEQCHAYGASLWYPFHGTGTIVGPSKIYAIPTGQVEVYPFRSHMATNVTACWDVRRTDLDYAQLRKLVGQLRRVQPYYYGDYYPLTPYSLGNDVWMAWQFDRPALGGGVVQAFRRPASPYESARFKLQGLDPAARYAVANLDEEGAKEMTGRELMEQGLEVRLPHEPQAAVFIYQTLARK